MRTLSEAKKSNDEYHARDELSSTQVATFLDDPIAFHELFIAKTRKREAPTDAMKFGTSVHEMIELGGPDKMPIVVIPHEVLNKDGHKRGKAWTQWKAEQPDDALLYKEGEAIPWYKIWSNLVANEKCIKWLVADRKEEELFWQDSASGLHCRAKLDVIDVSAIIDWKTTRSVDPRGFQSACHSMHYAERLSFYRRGYEQKYGQRPPCVAVAIENSGSYRVQPYEISESWLSKADENLSRVLDQIANFDIQSERNRPIIELSEPKYARFDDEFQLD